MTHRLTFFDTLGIGYGTWNVALYRHHFGHPFDDSVSGLHPFSSKILP